jgi:hypothetical protein
MHRIAVSFVVVSVLLLALPVQAQLDTAPAGQRWPVKYKTGTERVEKERVWVRVSRKAIICETGPQTVAFSIPGAAVSEVVYDSRAWRRSKEVVRLVEGAANFMGDDPTGGYASVLVVMAGLVTLPLAHAIKTTEHFVHLNWEVNGEEKEAVFQVGKNDYLAFLAELQRVSGREWKNLPALRERMRAQVAQQKNTLRQELAAQAHQTIAVWLDRLVPAGRAELAPGLYALVLLERGPQRGELLFFRAGKVDVENLAAVAAVHTVPTEENVKTTQVIYSANGDEQETIVAIQTPETTLHFLQLYLPFQEIP